MYGPVTNEELVGRAIARPARRGRARDQVRHRPRDDRPAPGINGRPEYVRSACDASLERLGVDHDRPLLPAPRRSERPDRGDRRRDGRAGRGRQGPPPRPLRGGSPSTIRRAARGRIRSRRCRASTRCGPRDPEDDGVLDTVRELGIGFVAYSPLGRGSLTGAIRNTADLAEDDFRRSAPRFAGENLEQNLALVDAVREIAAELGSPRRNCRSRGSSPAATTSSRFLARNGSVTSRRMPAPPASSSPPMRSRGSRPPHPNTRSPGPDTPTCHPSIVKATLE